MEKKVRRKKKKNKNPCFTSHVSCVTCHLSSVTCHLSPVTCDLTTTICSFNRRLCNAVAGGLVIDRVFKNNLLFMVSAYSGNLRKNVFD